jgi:SAM-dependent methyltransferase
MTDLKRLGSYDEEMELVDQWIRKLYDGHNELTILEAGCGRKWPLELNGTKFKLVGIDLDEAALKSRAEIVGDLDEAIVADLHDFDLGERQFDVVYSAFVLEHAAHADRMLENMYRALKPGGLMVLQFPDRDTVFGFITRTTPFWFHVLYKRYVEGVKNAGKPGFDPYPTYYHKIVSRRGIREFCKARGLDITEELASDSYLRVGGRRSWLVRAVAMLVSAASLGRLPWDYNNLIYVLQKA